MNNNSCILIVEDNDINATLLGHFLQPFNVKVERVTNGQQAIDFVKQNGVSLILMDINMPVMDGCEATKIIRSLDNIQQPPIIAVTADATLVMEQRCKAAGMDDFLAKPLYAQLLRDVVKPFLQAK